MTTQKEDSYRIVELSVSAFMRINLKGVVISPDGPMVKLVGENEQGKSSILQLIRVMLGGKKFAPEYPINKSATESVNKIDFGAFVGTLKFSAKSGMSLTLKMKDGSRIDSPATLLKNYSNEILLDPVGFVRLSENVEGRRKQAEELRKLLGLDFTELDAEKDQLYNRRTAVGVQRDTAQGKLKNFQVYADAPAEEVSSAKLYDQLEAIRKHNEANDSVRKSLQDSKHAVELFNTGRDATRFELTEAQNALGALRGSQDTIQQEITLLEQTLNQKRASLTMIEQRITDQGEIVKVRQGKCDERLAELNRQVMVKQTAVDALKYEDDSEVRKQIESCDETNTRVRGNKRHTELQAEAAKYEAEWAEMTKKLEAFEQQKKDAIAGAKFPLPGIGFTPDGITVDNLPFSQASQARQIRVACAIGFALKPKIRVVLIKDASLLDHHSLAELEKMALEHDGQVWLEEISSNDPNAILIEDGGVKERK